MSVCVMPCRALLNLIEVSELTHMLVILCWQQQYCCVALASVYSLSSNMAVPDSGGGPIHIEFTESAHPGIVWFSKAAFKIWFPLHVCSCCDPEDIWADAMRDPGVVHRMIFNVITIGVKTQQKELVRTAPMEEE